MKEYKQGTFDKHVAYGQRQRKLLLISRGVMDAFKVRCRSVEDAENLARAFRTRSRRIEDGEAAKFSLRVKVKRNTVYVARKGPLR
jgi:hypothetical protein